MPDECNPGDIPKVKAILEAVVELDREDLKNDIEKCASKTRLDVE